MKLLGGNDENLAVPRAPVHGPVRSQDDASCPYMFQRHHAEADYQFIQKQQSRWNGETSAAIDVIFFLSFSCFTFFAYLYF